MRSPETVRHHAERAPPTALHITPSWAEYRLWRALHKRYVADCKLASAEAMGHIDRGGGRFITVLPRSRKEDAAFRAWMQDHQPDWAEAHRAPGRIGEPDQVWSACQAPWPSAEGYRVVWIHDSGKQLRDAAARARKIEKGVQAIEDDLAGRLSSPRTRLRTAAAVHVAAEAALADAGAARWVRFTVTSKTRESFRQDGPGRPGPATTYRRIEKQSFAVTCDIDHDQVSYDAASDGCWPLITNDRDMTTAGVLAAYRYQPNLERRHHLLKGVQDAAPVWIKTILRIEAIFLCHFIALLISALIERQIRMAMKAAEIARIPIYPELRGCAAPTADRIFEIFAHVSRHELRDTVGNLIQVFEPELTELQLKILDLLGIPATIYTRAAAYPRPPTNPQRKPNREVRKVRRMVSQPEYLSIATMSAVVRFMPRTGSSAAGTAGLWPCHLGCRQP